MYDLPSDDLGAPGLPDEFHLRQPQLLRETFRPAHYPPDRVFEASDMNLYYDVRHPLWYKRPDWFAVLGISSLYEERDMRLSYVLWQEGVAPYLVVELLSPGTEDEDLGREEAEGEPPAKWTVYERLLRIPYYVTFSGHTGELHCFRLEGEHYQEAPFANRRLWLPEAGLGLGSGQVSTMGWSGSGCVSVAATDAGC